MTPTMEPHIWKRQPSWKPPDLPYVLNSQPEGTELTAAPMRKTPMVKGDKVDSAPRVSADRGPMVVNRVLVVSVRAQHTAKLFEGVHEEMLRL